MHCASPLAISLQTTSNNFCEYESYASRERDALRPLAHLDAQWAVSHARQYPIRVHASARGTTHLPLPSHCYDRLPSLCRAAKTTIQMCGGSANGSYRRTEGRMNNEPQIGFVLLIIMCSCCIVLHSQ